MRSRFGDIRILTSMVLGSCWLATTGLVAKDSKLANLPNKHVFEAAPCSTYVQIKVGERVRILPLGLRPKAKVDFMATLGKIVGDTYIAPNFVPASGIDDICIQNETGEPMGRIFFQIVGPASTKTQIEIPANNPPIKTEDVDGDDQSERVEVTIKDPQNVSLRNLKPLPVIRSTHGTGSLAPVINQCPEIGPRAKFLLVGKSVRLAGSKCAVNTSPEWLGQPCSQEGSYRSVGSSPRSYAMGPTTTIQGRFPQDSSGNFTWKNFAPGKTEVGKYRLRSAVSLFYKDYYQVKGGVWKYAYTKKCVKPGVFGFNFSPDPNGSLRKSHGFVADPSFNFGDGNYRCERVTPYPTNQK